MEIRINHNEANDIIKAITRVAVAIDKVEYDSWYLVSYQFSDGSAIEVYYDHEDWDYINIEFPHPINANLTTVIGA